jgi:hypothetical protein
MMIQLQQSKNPSESRKGYTNCAVPPDSESRNRGIIIIRGVRGGMEGIEMDPAHLGWDSDRSRLDSIDEHAHAQE